MSTLPLQERLGDGAKDVYRNAVATMFGLFEDMCEGAVAVDTEARIVWINEKYRALLAFPAERAIVGEPIEDVIPKSLLRQVVETGRPILVDIMQFGAQSFVVTRIPLRDDSNAVIGAVGFVLYDKVDYLKPLVSRFAALNADIARARRELALARQTKYTFSQFIGTSRAAVETKRQARRAAAMETTVILLGETGTGKELIAQAIHAASARASKAFVGVNLAAIPENLLEAEFFGVAPGAYTGADRKGRDGKFVVADGGTLFLDEIGDMPTSLQAKLLRALQEKEVEPLGSNKVRHVDVRVIAATSRDLKGLVETGAFRADLYYRLNVLPIEIAPLRERRSDVPAMAEVLMEQICGDAGIATRELTADAITLLSAYPWPGNVRELRNLLERAVAMTERAVVDAKALSALLPEAEAIAPSDDDERPLDEIVREVERDVITRALRRAGGNKVKAARALGLSRATLYDRLARLETLSKY